MDASIWEMAFVKPNGFEVADGTPTSRGVSPPFE